MEGQLKQAEHRHLGMKPRAKSLHALKNQRFAARNALKRKHECRVKKEYEKPNVFKPFVRCIRSIEQRHGDCGEESQKKQDEPGGAVCA